VLIDSLSNKAYDQYTDTEIEKASVIVLVYDVTNHDVIKNMRTYWLPRIVKINESVPIIICGNKTDLRLSAAENEMESLLTPTFMDFRQVEMGIECSAKGYVGLIDIISCA